MDHEVTEEFNPGLAIRKYCIYHCRNERDKDIGSMSRCLECVFIDEVENMLCNGWNPEGGPE